MAGEGADYIQRLIFPDMPVHAGLADVYLDSLYGIKPQISTMLHNLAQHRELIENGDAADPRRKAIIATLYQMYQITNVYRYAQGVIEEYDRKFWLIEFSDLMDELDHLDEPLNDLWSESEKPNDEYNLEPFSGMFAMNLARMIILANKPDLLYWNKEKTFNAQMLIGAAQDYSRQIGACMALYELFMKISGN